MPGVSRAGQDIAGSVILQGSTNVITNGSPTARVGDAVTGHGKTPHSGPVMAAGSPNVFANNIPVCRAGDVATCGHPASGSGDVLANGSTGSVVGQPFLVPANSSGIVTVGPGGTPNTGTTTRTPPNPGPGESYTVTITGAPDGPVTYTNPQTGQVETVMSVNGVVSINLTAPNSTIGKNNEQAISFEFADGTVNGGSLIVIPDAVTAAGIQFQKENPATWRDTWRAEYFKSRGAEPSDVIIVTDPGSFRPGDFWYDYLLAQLPDSPANPPVNPPFNPGDGA